LLCGWGYIVAFTKVLTIYKLYHKCIFSHLILVFELRASHLLGRCCTTPPALFCVFERCFPYVYNFQLIMFFFQHLSVQYDTYYNVKFIVILITFPLYEMYPFFPSGFL
jgi:hypothetical protein